MYCWYHHLLHFILNLLKVIIRYILTQRIYWQMCCFVLAKATSPKKTKAKGKVASTYCCILYIGLLFIFISAVICYVLWIFKIPVNVICCFRWRVLFHWSDLVWPFFLACGRRKRTARWGPTVKNNLARVVTLWADVQWVPVLQGQINKLL